jgi:hypothetical protein
MSFLPVTDIVIEVNKFDFQALDNPYIQKWQNQYQRGTLFGFKNVKDFIFQSQEGKCLLCGERKIENYHHIMPKRSLGSNTHRNLAGLCVSCHDKVHKDEKVRDELWALKEGIVKKYGGTAIINIAMPYIIDKLAEVLGEEHLMFTTGAETKKFRDKNDIEKTHANDAYCIACSVLNVKTIYLASKTHLLNQFRRRDRAFIHKQNCTRVYLLNGEPVAYNRRKACEQTKPSLQEFRASLGKDAEKIISKLTVKEHKPASKDTKRVMPGALVKYEKRVFTLIRTDGKHNGIPNYCVSPPAKGKDKVIKYLYKKCRFLMHSSGLVFMN